jgi:hypothetical protein
LQFPRYVCPKGAAYMFGDTAVVKVTENTIYALVIPGAGVDKARVLKPSKRVRAWYRASTKGNSLKAYSRDIWHVADAYHHGIVARWFANKAA